MHNVSEKKENMEENIIKTKLTQKKQDISTLKDAIMILTLFANIVEKANGIPCEQRANMIKNSNKSIADMNELVKRFSSEQEALRKNKSKSRSHKKMT